jgi:hypothetical protein
MNIKFDWKYSVIDMPNEEEKIFAYYDMCGRARKQDCRIVMGKFCGKDYIWEYGKGNFVFCLVGREMNLKSSINFGSALSYDLPLTGFFWDYIKPNVNIPTIKIIRKIKLDKINVLHSTKEHI